MLLRASAVARAVSARLVGEDATFTAASFDSRTVASGDLFVAVRGDRDGHDFAADAIERGATAVLCERELTGVGATQIIVDDSVAALARIAMWCRDSLESTLEGRVVGITGSVGKTSTKDLLVAAISADLAPCAASERSFNNQLGVPVTIIGAPDSARALVLEMGMSGYGEIDSLCAIARPTIGVVTAVADAHSAFVDGIEGIARAKSELVRALPATGVAVLNGDDARVDAMATLTEARVVRYGSGFTVDSGILDVGYTIVAEDDLGRCTVALRVDDSLVPGGWQGEVLVPVPGRHMAANAAGALTVAVCLGVSPQSALRGIAAAEVGGARMRWRAARHGARLLDDSYNANPASMLAAFETLCAVPARRRVAVLGMMAELGDPSSAHRSVAEAARERGIEVIAVGTDLYGRSGVTPEAAAGLLADNLDRDTVVLVKGSRVARLERVVAQLTG